MTIYQRSEKAAIRLIAKYKNPSKTRHERATRTPNGSGGFDTTWSLIAEVDFAIVPTSGSETMMAMQLEGKTVGTGYALYSDLGTATTDDRLVFEGRTLNIRAVMDIAEAKAAVEIIYEEGVQ